MSLKEPQALTLHQCGLVIALILAGANGLRTWIGWHRTFDVQGVWQIGLALGILSGCIYAWIFILVIRPSNLVKLKFVLIYNSILAMTLVLHTYFYYTIGIDWPAVNAGIKNLTLLQTAIRSDVTPLGSHLIFLLGAAIFAYLSKHKLHSSDQN